MKRIDILDFLRGFALLGIIFINIGMMVRYSRDFTQTDKIVNKILEFAVHGRFVVIFAFLFGVGFYLFVSRAKQRGERAVLLFTRRLLILFVFGVLLHFIFSAEILTMYGILGFLLLPFFRVKPALVLLISLVFIAGGSLYAGPGLQIPGMFLLGLWAGQIELFSNVARFRLGLRITQIAALLLIVPSHYAQNEWFQRTGWVEPSIAVGGLAVSVFYVTTLTLLLQKESVQRLLAPLKYMGRMALTNYFMHVVIIVTLNHLFGWSGTVHVTLLTVVAALILIVQMVYSPLWLKRFGIGPIEYVWRRGTYGKAFLKTK